ncbi:helix-turn-helix domain-containing protein [Streptomyces antarcticus]|uniref:helix-turn-helix domain-containing protein n=1 Tax=Streptomyces antarcticus TaxID=2996458 RepID=UPI00226F1CF6|nr:MULTISPECIES: helix-turn-helix domain-containing protein [unclassified Streptomyces]MCY0942530.1 helix-turn-helix domain-containing protein [Streptomyces sp. H34-AA3]MCZ4083780.1 helix-turn-helix domain-containing protein [Streptomyces sp. H34-S5]
MAPSIDPHAKEDLGLGGLDRAAHGRVVFLPSDEGVDLVRVEDVEARSGGVRAGWDVPKDERTAGVGVGDGDMLAVALRRRDARESVTAIAAHLGVGRSTLYRTLSAYDEAIATSRDPDGPSCA